MAGDSGQNTTISLIGSELQRATVFCTHTHTFLPTLFRTSILAPVRSLRRISLYDNIIVTNRTKRASRRQKQLRENFKEQVRRLQRDGLRIGGPELCYSVLAASHGQAGARRATAELALLLPSPTQQMVSLSAPSSGVAAGAAGPWLTR